jgi:peptide/nickel transport system substrate-binding protein
MSGSGVAVSARAVAALAAVLTTAGCLQVQKDLPPRPVAAVEDARLGGTITVAITAPTSVDPALVPPADAAGTLVVRTMCDSLLGTSPDSGNLRPDLASSVLVGGGGTLITVRLRRGLRFSDGTPMAAADVVAAITRVARPQVASPNAPLLRRVFGYQQLQQDEDKAHGRLAGVYAIDPRTVQVALTTPDSSLTRTLATAAVAPVPRRAGRDNGFGAFSCRALSTGGTVAPRRHGDHARAHASLRRGQPWGHARRSRLGGPHRLPRLRVDAGGVRRVRAR